MTKRVFVITYIGGIICFDALQTIALKLGNKLIKLTGLKLVKKRVRKNCNSSGVPYGFDCCFA